MLSQFQGSKNSKNHFIIKYKYHFKSNPFFIFTKIQFVFLFVLFLFQNTNPLSAQQPYHFDPYKKISQYIFDNWSNNEGLPSNSLMGITQSPEGYIWLTSYNGIIRFDGNDFFIFNTTNTPLLRNNVVLAVCADKTGTLWFGTQGSGLLTYRNKHFSSYQIDTTQNIFIVTLLVDKDNNIWAGTQDHGIYFFNHKTFKHYDIDGQAKTNSVSSLVQTDDGAVWASVEQKGLYKLEKDKFVNVTGQYAPNSSSVTTLYADSKKRLWICTDKNISYFDGRELVDVDNIPNVISLKEDNAGNIWGCSLVGIFRINFFTKKTDNYLKENGSTINSSFHLQFDKEGSLWITSYRGGLYRIKDSKFYNYTEKEGLRGKIINAICKYDKSTIIIGSEEGYLDMIHNEDITPFVALKSLEKKRIRSIVKDNDDNVWVGTYNGLLQIDKNKKEHWFTKKKGLYDEQIRVLFVDSKGFLWVGTRSSGIMKLKDGKVIDVFTIANGLNSNLILCLTEDKEGNIWAGTNNRGFNIIRTDGSVVKYSRKEGFKCDGVFNIYIDGSNVAWLATNNGISRFSNKKFSYLTAKEGFPADMPFDILKDYMNNFWMPSSKGIVKVQQSQLNDYFDGKIKHVNFKLYSKTDGLKEVECTAATKSLFTADGTLWFPTINGLVNINESYQYINQYIPPVYIEGIKADDRLFDVKDTIELELESKQIVIEYSGLSMLYPEKVFYKYKLEGFYDKWSDSTRNNTAVYTNIGHGNYVFRVIACNNDGIWNEKGAVVKIHIKPFFYQTIAFYVLIVILLFIAIFIVFKIRLRHLERRRKELENIVNERTKELSVKNIELEMQREEVMSQANYLQEANQKITRQNKEITNSISYASLIQRAVLMSDEEIATILPDAFVFWLPRDIVSGDFYWIRQIENYIYIAVADCTGHGVPGAFMSMLGYAFLNEIVKDHVFIEPNLILEDLRDHVKASLKQTGKFNETKDGMDLAFCVIDLNTNIMQFAGANSSLIIIKKQGETRQLIEIKPTKSPIGVYHMERPFENNTIQIEQHDVFYLFTDGYIDQFDETGKHKFYRKQFKELLLSVSQKPFIEQRQIFEQTYYDWKGNYEQIDDILVMGFKVISEE